MAKLEICVLLLSLLSVCNSYSTHTPVIGILDQPTYNGSSNHKYGQTYLAASYAKWIESSGGRVIPIHVSQDQSYYERVFAAINGIVFPGGGQYLKTGEAYFDAAKILYDLTVKANDHSDYFPLWGTCLGFELLTVLASDGKNWLSRTDAENWVQPVQFAEDFERSRMFARLPDNVFWSLVNERTTVNFHHWALTPKNFTKSGLDKFYQMLSYNRDRNAKVFISLIEAHDYPFFGSQFHPEKNNFEINSKQATPHFSDAVLVSQYFSNFFVEQARQNNHASPEDMEDQLIYNYQPTYTGKLDNSTFTQIYAFNVTN